MAVSNRDRIGRAFEQLAEGLGPWVDGEMRAAQGEGWFDAAVAAARVGKASLADPAFQLKMMWDRWNDVFGKILGRAERTLVNELSVTRNRWAHNEGFSFDDTYRALDSIERLLAAVSAPQADAVAKAKDEVLRARFDAEEKKATATKESLAVGAVKGLPPWREVVMPHRDVATGGFSQAEFAAHLGRVARGDGPAEYVDPVEFFSRTYLTAGLRSLLGDAVRRISGSGGDPVVNLQTSFGGGKTHSMLALWHLFSGVPLAKLPEEVRELVVGVGVESLPAVKRVVLVGTEIQAGVPSVKPDGTEVHTLWGEIAWQLGGAEAYREVEGADRSATSPGLALGKLFERYGPCLVLIDEWVAYARHLYSRDDLPAGTLDAQVTFAQALTEQAAAVDGTLVVVSIPASADGDAVSDSISEIEVGGVGGKEALRRLRSVVGRIDSPWTAATAEESFEIVRRRLFEPLIDPERLAERDAVARAFTDFYRREQAEFPTECRETAYGRRIAAAYPIHPELFARLYEDWSTLERFQRTRGVLRLMAAVIHALWVRQDAAPLVLPASIPLDDDSVRGELLKYLPDAWKPIIDSDVDGADATSVQLDRTVPNLGRYAAARRVARAIFLGTAPRSGSAHRGVEAQRVRLGCVIPGESVATYGDALNRLSDRSSYLYVEGARYWYGLQQSITRVAQDRAESWRLGRRDDLHVHLMERLKAERDRGDFAGVHIGPASGADVPDEPAVRLVVLGVDAPHVQRSEASPALAIAQEMLERRGSAAREYRNMVAFAAADQRRLDELEQAAAEFLAWKSIDEEGEELNLDPQMQRQARTKRAQADDAVRLRLADAYQWVLLPAQPDPDGPIGWEAVRAEGQGPLAVRVGRKLVAEGLLQTQFPPVLLRLQLDGPLASLWADGTVGVRKVWECFARYIYLPRLRDAEVLLAAVTDGPASVSWQTEGFALADGDDTASGRLLGLVTGAHPPRAASYSTLLVRPDVALGQVEQEAAEVGGAVGGAFTGGGDSGAGSGGGAGGGDVDGGGAGTDGVTARPRRFQGSIHLDPSRPVRDFDKVRVEVLDHLVALIGADVEVTVEISAGLDEGFPEHVVRTVTENAKTLRFEPGSGFEER